MSQSPSGPTIEDLRGELGQTVKLGLERYVIQEGGELVRLQVVQRRLPTDLDRSDNDAVDAATTVALREALIEAVSDVRSGKYRRLLACVLPLREDLAGVDLKERRSIAGREFKNGDEIVKGSTVRTYYEPKALDQLVAELARKEAAVTGYELKAK